MATTRAEAERRILDYLEDKASKDSAFESFTYSEVKNLVPENPELLDQALEALEKDKVIESHGINVKVYLPRSRDGKRVRVNLAKSSLVTYSPYGAIFLALAILYIFFYYSPTPSPPNPPTVPNLYQEGILSGIVYSTLVGLVLGYVIRSLIIRIRKWQLVSESTYDLVSRIGKYSIILIVVTLGAYYEGSSAFHYDLQQTVVIEIIGIIIAGMTAVFALTARQAPKGS